jgi:hypothetical protein
MILSSAAYQLTSDRKYAVQTAALVQRLSLPRALEVPADFPDVLRSQTFEQLVQTATQQWSTNNLYSAAIVHLAPLPYVIAAMQRAGMDEAAVFDASLRVANAPEPFEEVLDPANMSHEIGLAYQVGLKHGAPSDVAGGHSDLGLFEDGKPLGPRNSSHALIRAEGRGRYSHWGSNALWFSASDNSDPRTNGRQYKVVYPWQEPAP